MNEALSPSMRALVKGGHAAMKKAVLYLSNPDRVEHCNELWQMDMAQLPFKVVRQRGRGEGTFAWIVLITDYHSKAMFPPRLVVGKVPDRGDVLVCLGEAMNHDPARGPFRGIPEFLKPDNGLQLIAKDIQGMCHELGIEMVPTAAWAPHQKGLIERHVRTLKEALARILGEGSRGPRDKTGRLYADDMPPIAEQLVNEALLTVVDTYNHPSTSPNARRDGRTPLEIWEADATPLRMPTPQQHRRLFKVEAERVVRGLGIEFANGHYLDAALLALVNETVEVRYLPSDLRTIEVFRDGVWVCTAVRQNLSTDEERDDFIAERIRQEKAAEREITLRDRRQRARNGGASNTRKSSRKKTHVPKKPSAASADVFRAESAALLDDHHPIPDTESPA